jgi:hypothetical protein
MKTISSVVEKYIKSKPFLLNALSQGIINLTSLARNLTPDIEKELNKEVKQGAVVMALKRLSEDLDFRANFKIVKVLRELGEITVRSNLMGFTFKDSDTLVANQARMIAQMVEDRGTFFTSSRGVNETSIIVSRAKSDQVRAIFDDERIINSFDKLGSITVKLPSENINVSGIYYFIFQRLAWEGIVIKEVISTTNEFTIMVSEKMVDKAFKVIKDLKDT